jgi:hypothetical protein
MRLVANDMSRIKAWDAFTSTKLGIRAKPVHHWIESMLPGKDEHLPE